MNKTLKNRYNKLYSKYDAITWNKWNNVCGEMNDISWSFISNTYNADALGYTTRNGSAMSSYKVYISPKLTDKLRTAITLHEYGHILFQHLRFEDFKRNQVKQLVETYWNLCKKYIDFEKKNVSVVDDQNAKNALIATLQNQAMDMEVNSKYFDTDDERDALNALLNLYEINQISNNSTVQYMKTAGDKLIEEALTKMENGMLTPVAGLVWPQDYGFPVKLDWFAYIKLGMKDPEKLMKDLQKELDKQKNGSQQSDGSNQGKGNSKGKPSQSKGSSQGKSSKNKGSSGQGQGDEDRKAGKQGDGKIKISDLEKASKEMQTDGQWKSECSRERGFDKSSDLLTICKSPEELRMICKKFLLAKCVAQIKQRIYQDQLYNYNRGKTHQVIIPKNMIHTKVLPGNINLLIDVSGSVPIGAVNIMLQTITENFNKFGPESRVIFWSTELEGDISLKELKSGIGLWDGTADGNAEFIKAYCGGGTLIRSGIEYIKNKYIHHSDDKLFIISDFYDDLDGWREAIDNGPKCELYSIKWKYANDSDYNEEENSKIKNQFKDMEILELGIGFETED